MKIAASSTPKKPTYPTLLAIAAAGAMMTPASAQNETEKPPVPEGAKASQQAQLMLGVVKAQSPREPQRTVGKAKVRDPQKIKGRAPQGRAGDIKRVRYPDGVNGSAKQATSPEKK